MQSYPNSMSADGSGEPFYSQPSSSQQQQPDELQLTAQLSRGLVPIMSAGQGGGSGVPEGQDQRGMVQHYGDHEQAQAHGAHLQASPAQLDQMGGGQYAGSHDASNRKRSKVSRACDECRRKKIRCDATEDSGDQQCTNCKRTGTRCQFSRVPLKRGPSKGYIKELADRLHTLEGAMQAGELPVPQYLPQDSQPQRRGSEEYSPPTDADNIQRKRTHSSVSGDFGTPYQPQRPATGWASQEPSRNVPHPSSSFATPQTAPLGQTHLFREPHYSPNGLQSAPQWRNAPEPVHRQSSSFENIPIAEYAHLERAADLDDGIIDGYYSFIHDTYPLLPHAKTRLSSRLANCPAALRDAFHEALHAAVRSFPSPKLPLSEQHSSKKAAQLIIASQYENVTGRTFATNLVILQVMLLMAIQADNRDPAHNQVGFPQSYWLGSAVGLAYSMKLHAQKILGQQSGNDPDSEDKLARRIWWSLAIMDRWHAASTSSPLMVPETSLVIFPEDRVLLGENFYQLARLSMVVGHFALIHTADPPALGVPSGPIFGTLLRGELERFRESLPPSLFPPPNAPVVHLCYWSLRILMALRVPESEIEDLLDPAIHIITQLKHNARFVSPLTHHAAALAAAALIECKEHENASNEAEGGLSCLLESQIAQSGWDSSIREMIVKSKTAGPSSASGGAMGAKTATSQQQRLQQLAELASATEEGRGESSSIEGRKESQKTGGQTYQRFDNLRELVRVGYMSVLGRQRGDAVR